MPGAAALSTISNQDDQQLDNFNANTVSTTSFYSLYLNSYYDK